MNSENQKPTKQNKIVLLGIALFLLIFFPILALYMSSSGLSAYKKIKSEMLTYKDSVQIPAVDFLSVSKESETNINFYNDKVVIGHFYDSDCTNCDSIWAQLKRIQSEFGKKTRRIQLLSYALKDDSIPALKALFTQSKPDSSSWEILMSKDNEILSFLNNIKIDSAKAPYTFFLADRNGIIVNYYDARKQEEVNNLMKHATILLPAKEDRRKIRYKREKDLYQ
jgi:thiol-disulfide isomerase/thioredoxin